MPSGGFSSTDMRLSDEAMAPRRAWPARRWDGAYFGRDAVTGEGVNESGEPRRRYRSRCVLGGSTRGRNFIGPS